MIHTDIPNVICGKPSPVEFPLTLSNFLAAMLTLMCKEVVGHAARFAFSFGPGSHSSWAAVDSAGVESTDLDSDASVWTNAAASGMHASLLDQPPRSHLTGATGQQSRTGMESSGVAWSPVDSGGLTWIGVDAGGISPTPNGQMWPRELSFQCLSLPSTPPIAPRASGNGRHRVDAHRHAQETAALTPSPTPTEAGCHRTAVPIDDSQLVGRLLEMWPENGQTKNFGNSNNKQTHKYHEQNTRRS